MSKRFKLVNPYENSLIQEIRDTQSDFRFSYEKYFIDTSLVDLLNALAEENKEQADTIKHLEEYSGDLEYDNKTLSEENKQLKERLEKINGGYGHLTHRNGLTANEWVIKNQEKELKKKNKIIQNLKEENDNCKNDYRELFSNYVALEEKNEKLRKDKAILKERLRECGMRIDKLLGNCR